MAASNPLEPYCKALNKTLQELTVDALRSLFGHVYYIWRTFKPAMGEEMGLKYYGNVWAELARIGYAGAKQKFGLKEVKDLPTFGKIVQECFTGVPALYVTKRSTKKEHVGHVLWCANPAYGPADNTFCRHDYYRQEVYLTYVYIWALIDEAKKDGLQEEVLVDLPSGRCRDGAACACQIILRTKAADPDRHLPEIENKFIDLEMGKQEPVAYVLKKQKRSFEEQGPATFFGFFAVDSFAWAQINAYDKSKSQDIYNKLWQNFPENWVKEARLDLEIGRVTTAEELADVIMYCQKNKYIGFSKIESSENKVVIAAEIDPFVQVADMFKAPAGYKKALVDMDKDFVANILKETKTAKKAKAVFLSHIAKGDKKTEIQISL